MKKVLVIYNENQKNIPYIVAELERQGQDVILLSSDDFTKCKVSLSNFNGASGGSISIEDKVIELSEIKSVLCRGLRYYPKATSGSCESSMLSEFIDQEYLQTLWSFSTTYEYYWMNPPVTSRFLLDHNKIYQYGIASKFGLLTPKTLVSNNYEEIVAFCKSCGGEVAAKTVKSRMFQHNNGKVTAIYTNLLSTNQIKDNKDAVEICPMMIQEYIQKKLELRVTVVGKKIFSCAIYSQDSSRTKHDWRRYDIKNVRHQKYQLSKETEKKILELMDFWNLKYGAIDMIITPDDKEYFIEVNPNGQYGWIECITEMPITKAIAGALIDS